MNKYLSDVVEGVKSGDNKALLYMIGILISIFAITIFVDGNKVDQLIGKPTEPPVTISVPGGTPTPAPAQQPTPCPDVRPRPIATVAPALSLSEGYTISQMPSTLEECDYIFGIGLMDEDAAIHCTRIMNEMAEAQYEAHQPTREAQISAYENEPRYQNE